MSFSPDESVFIVETYFVYKSYNFCGLLKVKVFQNNPYTFKELKTNIEMEKY